MALPWLLVVFPRGAIRVRFNATEQRSAFRVIRGLFANHLFIITVFRTVHRLFSATSSDGIIPST